MYFTKMLDVVGSLMSMDVGCCWQFDVHGLDLVGQCEVDSSLVDPKECKAAGAFCLTC